MNVIEATRELGKAIQQDERFIKYMLCKEKNDALVELTLPKDANVYAAAYQLYLPDKTLLQAKVKEWIAEFEENEEIKKLEED